MKIANLFHKTFWVLAGVWTMILLAPTAAVAQNVFVAPNGNDSNLGTIDKPLKTLEAARNKVRSMLPSSNVPITVYLRGGIYELPRSFELTSLDSGKSTAVTVTYTAYQNEIARVVGSKALDGKAFVPVTDQNVLNRLPANARTQVKQFNLKGFGITDYGQYVQRNAGPTQIFPMELFINAQPQLVARYPNVGWVYAADPRNFLPASDLTKKLYSPSLEQSRLQSWSRYNNPQCTGAAPVPTLNCAWMYGLFANDWTDNHVPITTVYPTQKVLQMPHLGSNPINYTLPEGKRYFVYNLLEELDAPGEYYIDRNLGILYVWPNVDLRSAEVRVSMLPSTLISIYGTKNVKIRNLILEGSRGNGIQIYGKGQGYTGGSYVNIEGNIIRNVGGYGLQSLADRRSDRYASNNIYNTGTGGIYVTETGNLSTGERSGIVIENNHIHHVNRWERTYRPGVYLQGNGIKLQRNLLHDFPHTAILMSGENHTIEFNEIHDAVLDTDDAGAIYAGRETLRYPSFIQNNYLHHIGKAFMNANRRPFYVPPKNTILGDRAIYLDDLYSGMYIQNNIIQGGWAGALIGGGNNNVVQDNIILGTDKGIVIEARTGNTNASGNLIRNNILQNTLALPLANNRYVGNDANGNYIHSYVKYQDGTSGDNNSLYIASKNTIVSNVLSAIAGATVDIQILEASKLTLPSGRKVPAPNIVGLTADNYRDGTTDDLKRFSATDNCVVWLTGMTYACQ